MNHKGNIRLTAMADHNCLHIYMDLSGRKDYLYTHRYDSVLYVMLKDGKSLDELRRWRPSDMVSRYPSVIKNGNRKRIGRHRLEKLDGSVRHLIGIADEYLRYEAC